MLGGILAAVIAIWYYRTAAAKGGPAMQWGIAGVICYYVPNFLWQIMVAKPALVNIHKQTAPMKFSLWGYSSVLIGLTVAVIVWMVFLKNASFSSQAEE